VRRSLIRAPRALVAVLGARHRHPYQPQRLQPPYLLGKWRWWDGTRTIHNPCYMGNLLSKDRLETRLPPESPTPRVHAVHHRLSADTIQQLITDYQAGAPSTQLMLTYNLGKGTVLRLLREVRLLAYPRTNRSLGVFGSAVICPRP
jgi:hypothetical protein